MINEEWTKYIYSDGSESFISNPYPTTGEPIAIQIRIKEGAPVKKILLCIEMNGEMLQRGMKFLRTEGGFTYFRAVVLSFEPVLSYYFKIISDSGVLFYSQLEVTNYEQPKQYNFRIIIDAKIPSWVSSSVFYQIIPDRFCNGDTNLNVKDGEYTYLGRKSFTYSNWEDRPVLYRDGACLDFYGGDLVGIEKNCNYFKELGINAIYLTPIFSSPTSHKYDTLDYFEIDKHLGGDEGLERLIKSLHENDIKLILDIALNHVSYQSKWFNKEAIFFNLHEGAYNNPSSKERGYFYFNEKNEYLCWNGLEQYPKLNYESAELKKLIYGKKDSVLLKWLREPYNIDGWRFDTAAVVGRFGRHQYHHNIWREIRQNLKSECPECYLVGEYWRDANEFLNGDEWDGAMNYYGSAIPIRRLFGGNDITDSWETQDSLSVIDFVSIVKKYFASMPWTIRNCQMNILDSHDCYRMHLDKRVTEVQRMAAVAVQYMLPGAPTIYYGDELNISGWIENTEGCRLSMPWNRESNCESIFLFYRILNNLKTSSSAMHDGGFNIEAIDESSILIIRFNEKEAILFFYTTKKKDYTIDLSKYLLFGFHENIFIKNLNININGNLIRIMSYGGAFCLHKFMK